WIALAWRSCWRRKMQQWWPESDAMTFDEASVERSKSFVKSLQVFPGPSLLSLPFRPPPDRIRSSHRLFLARVFCTYFAPHESVSVSVFVFVRLEDCGNLCWASRKIPPFFVPKSFCSSGDGMESRIGRNLPTSCGSSRRDNSYDVDLIRCSLCAGTQEPETSTLLCCGVL
ncbi:hypothetical protein GW17_00051250, partial [Ensete ventricosum]